MASVALGHDFLQLARSLPSPLLTLFKKYPPLALRPSSEKLLAQAQVSSVAAVTSSTDANANTPTQVIESTSAPGPAPSSTLQPSNPFLPFKHPVTQRWQPPAYSLRRQADLVKLAQKHNVLSLLPWTPKLPSEVEKRRAEHGLRVKGTGVGQKVKGKMWERTLKGRLEDRRKAMEAMPEMIRAWKERGHGRGWKKWPK